MRASDSTASNNSNRTRRGVEASGANSQASASGTEKADNNGDYETNKGGNSKSSIAQITDEERRMVADLDRFDANDENDNLEDSF